MTEYAVRLANDPVVHSIQIDDGRDNNMPEDDEYSLRIESLDCRRQERCSSISDDSRRTADGSKAHELVLNEKQHLWDEYLTRIFFKDDKMN